MLIIRKMRLQRGWSQAELAHFSGLSVRTIQRIEKGENPGLETLKSLAAVFDLDVADLQSEANMDNRDVSIEERRAFEYVQELKGFYGHLLTYVIVVAGLFTLNILTVPEYIWAKWPAFGWGIGVLVHGIRVKGGLVVFGPDWEKRQVEKRLGRDL